MSPESFYAGSVRAGLEELERTAFAMVEAGAALIDVGARSTAPYRDTAVTEDEEARRLGAAVERLAAKLPVAVSADTCRPGPARVALEAGARVLNDVSGLHDSAVARLVVSHGASVILMASPSGIGAGGPSSTTVSTTVDGRSDRAEPSKPLEATGLGRPPHPDADPVATIRAILTLCLQRARAAGIPEDRIVLDPGIGFFLEAPEARAAWDVTVLARLNELTALGRPLAVGLSRKSFIGALTGQASPEGRLAGSLAATAVAVLQGAALVRTHDVADTRAAVVVADRLRKAGAR